MSNLSVMPNMLGIDVSKNKLDCTLLEAMTRKALWQCQVPNTTQGITQLLDRLDRLPTSDSLASPVSLVLEPTGRYSRAIAQRAHADGKTVLLAPPRRAHAFLQSVQSRAKTDTLDSRSLALFALSQPLRPYPIKSDAVEKVDQLLSARKGISSALTRLQMQRKELPHAAQALDAALLALKTQKAVLDKQIAARVGQEPSLSPTATRLQQVPGIGPITAAAVTARLADKQFLHPDSFVSYIGLDVAVRQSGQKSGNLGLTHQGDAELRRLFYLAAQSNLRSKDPDNPFKLQYERERAKGLSTTAALCAVARKLAKLCWSLHKHQSEYDPARVAQQGGRRPKQSQGELKDAPQSSTP